MCIRELILFCKDLPFDFVGLVSSPLSSLLMSMASPDCCLLELEGVDVLDFGLGPLYKLFIMLLMILLDEESLMKIKEITKLQENFTKIFIK